MTHTEQHSMRFNTLALHSQCRQGYSFTRLNIPYHIALSIWLSRKMTKIFHHLITKKHDTYPYYPHLHMNSDLSVNNFHSKSPIGELTTQSLAHHFTRHLHTLGTCVTWRMTELYGKNTIITFNSVTRVFLHWSTWYSHWHCMSCVCTPHYTQISLID